MLICGLVLALTAGAAALAMVPEETASQPDLILTTMLRDPAPFDAAVKTAELVVVGTISEIGVPVRGAADESEDPAVWTPVKLVVERSLKALANAGETVTFAYAREGRFNDDRYAIA